LNSFWIERPFSYHSDHRLHLLRLTMVQLVEHLVRVAMKGGVGERGRKVPYKRRGNIARIQPSSSNKMPGLAISSDRIPTSSMGRPAVANSTAPSPVQRGPTHRTILPKGRAAMEDTEDTSSVRIWSFQPGATQNYIDIHSLSPSLQLPPASVITLPRGSKTYSAVQQDFGLKKGRCFVLDCQ
jgi:hypothetical protein